MDVLGGHLGQLRHVAADELALGVELLRLVDRVEDAEIRLRIAAGACRPLPAAVVGGLVEVDQLACEVGLAQPPIEQQVLGKKTRRYHAQAVVHVAGGVELAHRGIHQWIPRAAFLPSSQPLGVLVSHQRLIFRPEGAVGGVREVVQDGEVEVAPDEFVKPSDFAFRRAVAG